MTTLPDFTGYSDSQIEGAIAYTVAVCPRPLLLQIAHHQWADATGGAEECDLTRTPDAEVRQAIRNMLTHTSRACDEATALARRIDRATRQAIEAVITAIDPTAQEAP